MKKLLSLTFTAFFIFGMANFAIGDDNGYCNSVKFELNKSKSILSGAAHKKYGRWVFEMSPDNVARCFEERATRGDLHYEIFAASLPLDIRPGYDPDWSLPYSYNVSSSIRLSATSDDFRGFDVSSHNVSILQSWIRVHDMPFNDRMIRVFVEIDKY